MSKKSGEGQGVRTGTTPEESSEQQLCKGHRTCKLTAPKQGNFVPFAYFLDSMKMSVNGTVVQYFRPGFAKDALLHLHVGGAVDIFGTSVVPDGYRTGLLTVPDHTFGPLAFGHHRNCGLNLDAVDARMPRSRLRGIRDLSTGAGLSSREGQRQHISSDFCKFRSVIFRDPKSYTLVMTNSLLLKMAIYSEFSHQNW